MAVSYTLYENYEYYKNKEDKKSSKCVSLFIFSMNLSILLFTFMNNFTNSLGSIGWSNHYIVNTTKNMSSYNVTISGNEDWGMMCISVQTLFSVFLLLKYFNISFLLTSLWLYLGVMLNHTDIIMDIFPYDCKSNTIINYTGYNIIFLFLIFIISLFLFFYKYIVKKFNNCCNNKDNYYTPDDINNNLIDLANCDALAI